MTIRRPVGAIFQTLFDGQKSELQCLHTRRSHAEWLAVSIWWPFGGITYVYVTGNNVSGHFACMIIAQEILCICQVAVIHMKMT